MVKEDNCEEAPLKVLEEDESNKGIGCLFAPLFWFRTLAKELHWSFVFGVISVYGISQGLGGALARVGTEYYMKDVQKVQPSEAQVYAGITSIPWIVKPLWGLLTDVLPVFGYRRRPYLMLSGLLGMCSMLVLSMHENLHLALALLSLTAGSAGVAIADVTIDACVAHNSINHPSLAADMQSLCSFSSSIGALIGFSISGIFVHLIGPMGVFGLMTLPAALVFSVGILLNEPHIPDFAYKQVSKKFCDVSMAMWKTLKCPDVWRPCLYMYLSFALSFNIFDGMFYWYTDSKDGPKFSKEAIGYIFSVGSAGALIGTILYQIALKDHPFRNLLFWTQLLLGLSGMLDLVLVFRLNLRFGIPDYFFVVIDECVSQMIYRLKWMPLLVLSTKLCPPGIEGTFFALLMSIDNAGLLSSSWGGGFLLHVLNVTRTQFDNLWIAILIRNILRVAPLLIIFLVPSSDPKSSVLPTESTEDSKETETTECRNIELVSLVKSADSDNVRHNSSV